MLFMVLKDNVVEWFIKSVIIPQQEIMDKPGFVFTKVTNPDRVLLLREVFLSEKIFSELEKQIVKKYGAVGIKALYTAGKRAGYSYSVVSKFKKITEFKDIKPFSDFLYLFVRYVGTIWAKNITYKQDYTNKKIEFEMSEFIICRLNGLGYFLVEGNTAGFWAYLMNDVTVEGYQESCQGKGDSTCKMIFAPISRLPLKKPYFGDVDYSNLDLPSKYEQINKLQNLQYSKVSILNLINNKVFKYSAGIIERNGERFFNVGLPYFYLLELELKQLNGASSVLFDISFEFGKSFINSENAQGVIDYLSAMGWGDLFIMKKSDKYSVIANFFPWTQFAENIDFSLYRGLLSGMLSSVYKKDIKFRKFTHSTISDAMLLIINED